MAPEMARSGVTVDDVLPGRLADRRYALVRAEVANLITYVASDEAAATTGGALRVGGGVASSIIP